MNERKIRSIDVPIEMLEEIELGIVESGEVWLKNFMKLKIVKVKGRTFHSEIAKKTVVVDDYVKIKATPLLAFKRFIKNKYKNNDK